MARYVALIDGEAGAYGVKCLPHFAMGMVALVVVGNLPPANLDAVTAAKVPPKAKARFEPLFAQAIAAQAPQAEALVLQGALATAKTQTVVSRLAHAPLMCRLPDGLCGCLGSR